MEDRIGDSGLLDVIMPAVNRELSKEYCGRRTVQRVDELYRNPLHPYTKALMSAVPVPDPDARKQRIILEGDVPSPLSPPPGCVFHNRCASRKKICTEESPPLEDMGGGHLVACHMKNGGVE